MDTTRYLDWFKDVQKSHGSVEKTSLFQVGNINARGVFRLGKGKDSGMVRNVGGGAWCGGQARACVCFNY